MTYDTNSNNYYYFAIDNKPINESNNEIYINENNELDEIDEDEEITNTESKLVDGRMYIGLPLYAHNNYLIGATITAKSYFKYNTDIVYEFLNKWSYAYSYFNIPQLMKLQVNYIRIGGVYTEEYSVLIKTFWLKIVQRRWKKVYRERMSKLITLKFMRQMGLVNETQFNKALYLLPSVKGMMI